jgi:hypothetical protein
LNRIKHVPEVLKVTIPLDIEQTDAVEVSMEIATVRADDAVAVGVYVPPDVGRDGEEEVTEIV